MLEILGPMLAGRSKAELSMTGRKLLWMESESTGVVLEQAYFLITLN
jgi:hypothetical protein